jgi:hypothetical protein
VTSIAECLHCPCDLFNGFLWLSSYVECLLESLIVDCVLEVMEDKTMNTRRIDGLGDIFDDIDGSLRVRRIVDNVFDISRRIDKLASLETRLGKPFHMKRYVSVVRHKAMWLGPRTGGNWFDIDQSGVLLQFERTDGLHVVLLPCSGTDDSCTTQVRSGDGNVLLSTRNDSSDLQISGQRAFVAYGTDVNALVEQLFAVCGEYVLSARTEPIRQPQWKPRWVDGLMYCTWNGLGSGISHGSILDALKELQDSGVRVSGIIIDDGWQHIAGDRELVDFEADPNRFPKGLKGLVDDIRTSFPYIKDVGVWSTIVGYWNGFSHGSKADQAYKTIDCQWGNRTIRVVDRDDVFKFYEDYFSHLQDCGINCVKIDSEEVFDTLNDPKVRDRLWRVYQDALRINSVKYFGGQIIYCMAMVPNIMLYALRQTDRPIPVFRNSDDFFPDDMASHFWHVYANFYNTIYTRHLYVLLDFDMFQTKLERGRRDKLYDRVMSLHAAARCISGGPVYFTDTPRIHDVDLLKALSSRGANHHDVVLRPNNVASPLDPYKPYDSTSLHWIKNSAGPTGEESYLLGAFNISHDTVSESVDWTQFTGAGFILRSYKSGDLWSPSNHREMSLSSGDWDIVTAAPLVSVNRTTDLHDWELVSSAPLHESSGSSIALFGLIDNISGSAGLCSVDVIDGGSSVVVSMELKAYGIVGLYASFPVDNVEAFVNGVAVDSKYITKGKLLTIDIRDSEQMTKSADTVRAEVRFN